jgi:hypothetical protein
LNVRAGNGSCICERISNDESWLAWDFDGAWAAQELFPGAVVGGDAMRHIFASTTTEKNIKDVSDHTFWVNSENYDSCVARAMHLLSSWVVDRLYDQNDCRGLSGFGVRNFSDDKKENARNCINRIPAGVSSFREKRRGCG